MRDYAITTLKKIGPGARAALPALRKVAETDASPDIRSLAANAVEVISSDAATPAGDKDEPAGLPTAKAATTRPTGAGPVISPGHTKHDMSVMVTTFPELARSAAPSWVRSGVRITYYAASATIAGKGPVFQLDPQGPIFATDGSGRRYSVKPGGRGEGMGGHGYGEYTIMSVGPDAVAIAADVYTIAGAISVPRLMTRTAYLGIPGSANDLWVSPDWLKRVKTGMGTSLRILRMPYNVGSVKRPAVAFTTPSSDMVLVYDETTGVLLYRGGSGEG